MAHKYAFDMHDILDSIMRLACRKRFLVSGLVTLFGATGALAFIDPATWIATDNPAIKYFESPLQDPVALLEQKLESGQAKLEYQHNALGYLPSLLKNLDINPDSQMLVFSKTSFQASRISTKEPRALYFNDNVAIGFVKEGEVYEVVSLDPKQGIVFYTLDIHESPKPGFARRDVCLQCHQGPATLGVPGIFISSVYPGPTGMPAFRAGAFATDDRTPLDKRWGGWYVTGLHGSQHHMGNAVALDPQRPELLELQGTQNLTSLNKKVDLSEYLEPTSDIVALMTYEHQTHMTNLMTRIGWEERIAEHDGKTNDEATRKSIDSAIEEMVSYMLFADELVLREPIQGVSTFSKTFPQRGPRDKQGRSLRDFDLQKRLFRYPLSYMIYSPAFDSMPDAVREKIYRRVYDVLTGKDTSPRFARLSAEDRRNVLEIVRDTKPNLPAYWNAQTSESSTLKASSAKRHTAST
jgi:hypothetical protein